MNQEYTEFHILTPSIFSPDNKEESARQKLFRVQLGCSFSPCDRLKLAEPILAAPWDIFLHLNIDAKGQKAI